MRKYIAVALIAIFTFCGCTKEVPEPVIEEYDNTLVYFAMAYNNLYANISKNIDDICKGDIGDKWGKNAILIFSHTPERGGDYTTVTSPVLFRIYRATTGKTVRDTLVVFPKGTVSASAKTVKTVMEYAKDNFPAKCTGILVSSHGTGWIQSDDPDSPDYPRLAAGPGSGERLRPTFERFRGENPLTKTIGSQFYRGTNVEYSIDIDKFGECLPYKLDYILLDACLMGGVETAWALKDKCDYLAFSPTEILSPGFNIYKDIPSYLFRSGGPDLQGLCKAYYEYYRDVYSSHYATISLIETSKLQGVADATKTIITNHLPAIKAIDDYDIQSFYTESYKYIRCFCDLRHIAELGEASAAELQDLDNAIADCVIYKAHTDKFFSNPIEHFCGLSMYLPGGEYDSYFAGQYRNLSWNTEVSLVK